ncbi:hypothetical protein OPKNFCMD_0235 [Methylobacterium crusticola]|uniref:Glycosyltransferase subfamily 4-like N-terminal domain-containing protein n=1 Tax=Methylobacterium crusticola TaxID=1697972 RepID=A0ABQ4QSF1_9HYPH|nr:glycosyltransferase [Methylobacterium crusticola]GJD47527.1 hypothetical protein OPKNFCMD_0235 [Methylobacterium crusticola]
MRIMLPTVYDTHGGSTRVLLAAAEALRAEHVVQVRGPIPEADVRTPARFPAAPLAGTRAKLAALPRLAGLIAREAAALRAFRPDVVYVHDEPSLYVHGLAARALRPRPTIVWHLHAGAGQGLSRRLREALADRRIVISRHGADASRLPTDRVRNPLTAPPAPREGCDPAALAVVGALTPRKNQMLALDTLALLAREGEGASLALIGPPLNGAYAQALRRRAAACPGAVRLLGGLPAAAVWEEVAGIALFPALRENQPLALAEALAAGIPFVATDIPAHREMVEEAGADPACLALPEPAAFARALRHARAHPPDPGLRARVRALYAPARFAAETRAVMRAVALARNLDAARPAC